MDLVVHDSGVWAGDVADLLRARVKDLPEISLCLPTGNTPKPMYREFAANGGDLSRATVYLLDEFGLPSGSRGTCQWMLRRDLLSQLEAQPFRYETWDTESADLDGRCSDMERSSDRTGIDLMILGIGANGHLGLNEPGSQSDSHARVVDLTPETVAAADAYSTAPAPTWGVTFGFHTILRATEVWLLATEEHKAEIVSTALRGPVTSGVPASFLQNHPNATLMVDTGAASAL